MDRQRVDWPWRGVVAAAQALGGRAAEWRNGASRDRAAAQQPAELPWGRLRGELQHPSSTARESSGSRVGRPLCLPLHQLTQRAAQRTRAKPAAAQAQTQDTSDGDGRAETRDKESGVWLKAQSLCCT